jgi:DNA (cytosine-5)-methyltransferase 1
MKSISKNSREVWSLFSGAMGLDIGLEQAGLDVTLACEIDQDFCKTIRNNKPNLSLVEGDVAQQSARTLRAARNNYSGEVFLLAGGPPCQSYSSGGKRLGLEDPRGGLMRDFFRLVGEIRPLYFVMENVANLATAALRHRPIDKRPGKHWSLKRYDTYSSIQENLFKNHEDPLPLEPDELAGSAIRALISDVILPLGYNLNFGVLDAADYGAPQHRLRFVMLGSRDAAAPELPAATHGPNLLPRTTVRDAIWHLQENPGPHSEYTPDMAKFFSLVPEGGNWRDLPKDLHEMALGGAFKSGGGKTGFFRRLAWDKPSCTMTGKSNRKASAVCHPSKTRPLSALECAALQGFPDNWKFFGSTGRRYVQAGNAVPVALGRAIGEAILKNSSSLTKSEKKSQDANEIDKMTQASIDRVRSAGANKRSKAMRIQKAA